MIGQRELERRAAKLGISLRHAAQDYVLNHVLAEIAVEPEDLVFRGGTALARVYWPDFRISEDLDFISPEGAPGLEIRLTRAARRAAENTGLTLEVEVGRIRDDRSRSLVRWTAPWGGSGELLVDIVLSEHAVMEVRRRSLVLPYTDLADVEIPVMDMREILGSKWLMLDDRDEPRDLFDLWWAVAREAVPFSEIAEAHRTKYGYLPMRATLERARRLGRAWDQRLAYQRADLPAFDEVLDVVEAAFRGWSAS